MLASVLSSFMGEPDPVAWIQDALEVEKSMLPPLQLEQLLHRMLAVMVLPSMPEPSSRAMLAEDETDGVDSSHKAVQEERRKKI